MKSYIKPSIEDEKIELEDIIAMSSGGDGQEQSGNIWDDLTPED